MKRSCPSIWCSGVRTRESPPKPLSPPPIPGTLTPATLLSAPRCQAPPELPGHGLQGAPWGLRGREGGRPLPVLQVRPRRPASPHPGPLQPDESPTARRWGDAVVWAARPPARPRPPPAFPAAGGAGWGPRPAGTGAPASSPLPTPIARAGCDPPSPRSGGLSSPARDPESPGRQPPGGGAERAAPARAPATGKRGVAGKLPRAVPRSPPATPRSPPLLNPDGRVPAADGPPVSASAPSPDLIGQQCRVGAWGQNPTAQGAQSARRTLAPAPGASRRRGPPAPRGRVPRPPPAHRWQAGGARSGRGLRAEWRARAGPGVFSGSRLGRGGPGAGRARGGFKGAAKPGQRAELGERGGRPGLGRKDVGSRPRRAAAVASTHEHLSLHLGAHNVCLGGKLCAWKVGSRLWGCFCGKKRLDFKRVAR